MYLLGWCSSSTINFIYHIISIFKHLYRVFSPRSTRGKASKGSFNVRVEKQWKDGRKNPSDKNQVGYWWSVLFSLSSTLVLILFATHVTLVFRVQTFAKTCPACLWDSIIVDSKEIIRREPGSPGTPQLQERVSASSFSPFLLFTLYHSCRQKCVSERNTLGLLTKWKLPQFFPRIWTDFFSNFRG